MGWRTARRALPGLVAALLVAVALSLPSGSEAGTSIQVQRLSDDSGGAGCSLRDAVRSANTDASVGGCVAGSGADIIVLGPGTYTLTIPEAGGAPATGGDLDISGDVTIQGAGATATTIRQTAADRVLEVLATANVAVSGLTVTGGSAGLGAAGVDGANGSAGSTGQRGQDSVGGPGGLGADGGGVANRGTLALDHVAVTDNRAGTGGRGGNAGTGGDGGSGGGSGGAAVSGRGGAGGNGGGILNDSSAKLTLVQSTVTGNTAGAGGAGGLANAGGTGAPTGGCTSKPCQGGSGGRSQAAAGGSGGSGGGIFNRGSLLLTGTGVSRNAAGAGGAGGTSGIGGDGAVGDDPGAFDRAGAGGSSLAGNGGPGGNGGGIAAVEGTLSILGTAVADNAAGMGGAGGSASVGGNGGAGGGPDGDLGGGGGQSTGGAGGTGGNAGGVETNVEPANIAQATISGNRGGVGGNGGDSGAAGSPGTGNAAGASSGGSGGPGGAGAGITMNQGTLTITNATVTANAAADGGAGGAAGPALTMRDGGDGGSGGSGGGLLAATGSLALTHLTLSSNAAGAGGAVSGTAPGTPGSPGALGGLEAPAATVSMARSIAANNPGGCSSVIADQGDNVAYQSPGCPGLAADPLLGPLDDNGGPTLTRALGLASPALDHPSVGCATADQRGVTRPQGTGCDSGAFEAATPTAVTGGVSALGSTSATIGGQVTANAGATGATFHVEYGTTSTYGSSTAPQAVGGVAPKEVAGVISGLSSQTQYHYRLVTSNAYGSAAGADQTFTTPVRTQPTSPAILSRLRVSPRAFPAARTGPSDRAARARSGALVSFRLDRATTVRFTIERALPGRQVRGRCVRPTRSSAGKRQCIRYGSLRRHFNRTGVRGANRFRLTGRLGGRTLGPGRYRLEATPSPGTRGASRRAQFRITR